MSALRKLLEIGPNKPYLGFAKLANGFHKIFSFSLTKNKFGKKGEKSILVELDDQVLFLPKHFNSKIDGEDVKELNEDIGKNKNIYLYFGGQDEKTR